MDPGNTNWRQGPGRLTLPIWPCGIQSLPMGKLVLVAPWQPSRCAKSTADMAPASAGNM